MKTNNDEGDQNGMNNVRPHHFKPIAKCARSCHLYVHSAVSDAFSGDQDGPTQQINVYCRRRAMPGPHNINPKSQYDRASMTEPV